MKIPSQQTAVLVMLFGFLVGAAVAQDSGLGVENPLAVLKAEVERVLEEAGVPFSAAQDNAVVLMMEDRRQASEELFGDLMDFSAGPTQGQEADRVRSAIEWMRDEFLTNLEDYLDEAQLVVWDRYREASDILALDLSARNDRAREQQQQTQYVRINVNDYSAEETDYRLGQRRTEVIERGGVGAFHGNVQFLLKDEALNASRRSYNRGRRVPTSKPPYQERELRFDVSGPVIPGRLTLSVAGSQNEAENVDTINATVADGSPFSREVVRPTTHRSLGTGGTYQFADAHSLTFDVAYAPYREENQGIGGFVLPERAWTTRGHGWDIELRQFSSFSAISIYETRFKIGSSHEETLPDTSGAAIDVVDAFSIGGSGNRTESDDRIYEFDSLYTRTGERLVLRAGMDGIYRKDRVFSTANFDGTFTFSSLEDFNAGRPFQYRVARGEPELETGQLEMGVFMQNDWSVTPELTVYFGLRYDWQTNLSDWNNFAPRLAFAYGLGPATVIRGGAGIYYDTLPINMVQAQKRFDGTRQYEIVIDNPPYPDPFQSGTGRTLLEAVRVTDPDLAAPYTSTGTLSLERTFLTTLFLSASYQYEHLVHRQRLRNLNAPYDITAPVRQSCTKDQGPDICVRPDPTRSDILNLEGSKSMVAHYARLTYRQRFSIFNVSANYLYQRVYSDGGPNRFPSDTYNLAAEWALDRRFPTHTVNSTLNAQLPLGIFLTGTVSANSGERYDYITGTDDNQDGYLTDRPVGSGRNPGKGPKFLQFDLNISKAIFLESAGAGGTRTNANVFANITNLFNRVNYNVPSGVQSSPNFGLPTSAKDPRLMEIGLRFQF